MDSSSQPGSFPSEELAGLVSGELLGPDDPGYDGARAVWNCRFESRPDAILRCASADDVAAGVKFARSRGLPLCVKSGGHDYAGNSACREGLLLDLSAMATVEIDGEGKRARVQAGATWGSFDREAQRFRLATTGGTVSSVGVAGFTLGGGEGWLSRKHGLALDNVLAMDVVTAAGERVRASDDENPDLFWGLRGGGGNLGIVTSFELALHDLGPDVLAGQVIYPIERAPQLLRFYRDYFEDAPDEVGCCAFILRIPPVEPFPEAYHGKLALDFVVGYMGDPADAAEALAPFRGLGEPILDLVAVQPYSAFQQSFDLGLARGFRWYSRAHYLRELSDDAIDALLSHLDPFPGAFTTVYLSAGGGAVGRVAPGATAFPHRDAAHGLHIFPGWEDQTEDAEIMAWARGVSDAMAPHSTGGVYVNLLAEDQGDRIPAAYGANFDRLAALKREWDPENVLCRNHNIDPSG